ILLLKKFLCKWALTMKLLQDYIQKSESQYNYGYWIIMIYGKIKLVEKMKLLRLMNAALEKQKYLPPYTNDIENIFGY
ncbi:hypothetical protein DFQ30_002912, partial [Apophysomyces sp. BC1015]